MENQQHYRKINTIRKRFLSQISKEKLDLDEIDIQMVCCDDWVIERFLLDKKNQKQAFTALLNALSWKNEIGVHKRKDDYYMREIFEWGDPELYGRDNEGCFILWFNIRNTNFPNIQVLFNL